MSIIMTAHQIATGDYPYPISKAHASATLERMNGHTVALLHPGAGEKEPRLLRFLCGMQLALDDGRSLGPQGQLVITAVRIIGMLSNIPSGKRGLNDPEQKFLVFSLRHAEVQRVESRTNWRGRVSEVAIVAPDVVIRVSVCEAIVMNDGAARPSSLDTLLEALSPASRALLEV